MKSETISIRIPKDEHNQIKKAAKFFNCRNQSDYFRMLHRSMWNVVQFQNNKAFSLLDELTKCPKCQNPIGWALFCPFCGAQTKGE